jgi:THAP domain
MKNDKCKPTTSSFICSDHFADSCFRRYHLQVRLKEDAVPSIFYFSPHRLKKVDKQQPLVRHPIPMSESQSWPVPCSFTSSADTDTNRPPSVQKIHSCCMKTSPHGLNKPHKLTMQQDKQRHDVIAKRLPVAQQARAQPRSRNCGGQVGLAARSKPSAKQESKKKFGFRGKPLVRGSGAKLSEADDIL